MTGFKQISGIAAALPEDNIDTDVIYPGRFLTRLSKQGMHECLFYDRRFDSQGQPKADFVLNQQKFAKTKILIAGNNFGCGSSRETAVWALTDYGIKCVIAQSFGEIFYSNCFNNMLLPIVLSESQIKILLDNAAQTKPITIDLATQSIEVEGKSNITFEIGAAHKQMLISGLDEISRQLTMDIDDISAFENKQSQTQPWLWN
ncbi:3-isopropylmalate dehydratase small subunit [Aliiglaciecola lipolytica]|uniref:3-isopropylmalate dehydratase small subunit n=1 Tax=Aliiglaciecola lipolytica TaxID=477689 RepID=UPI001C0968BD|nr:3-isopropylmalate dehydratase small subunit [Aliiglaciecola lipolytica]MBU2878399.1 3-isopropylmalate dehydratase small subunit [Aliiglaciecola lipolytica]